ncbi:hypothetical protein SH528x_003290 [Novipirellula sp. SH528]|uniref:hypothetical protein n=1 Tax=Novipirellula sp. SH528 TaxID=3454466 RepID=UPI003FA11DB2
MRSSFATKPSIGDQQRRSDLVDLLASVIVDFLARPTVDTTKHAGTIVGESSENLRHARLSSSATDRSL